MTYQADAGLRFHKVSHATGLVEAAEATDNPHALSFALLAHGFAFRDADPDRAREALRRGLVIAAVIASSPQPASVSAMTRPALVIPPRLPLACPRVPGHRA